MELDRLMKLWDTPPGPDAEDAFRELYADPVRLNGTEVAVATLVTLARALHGAFADQRREILDVVEAGPDRVAVAFVVHGRHVGPLPMRLGTVAPTGTSAEMAVIDIFTLSDGRITEVRAVSDELGLLLALDAVRPLITPPGNG